MSPETIAWLHAFHLFGVLSWLGTMIGLSHTLVAHGQADLGSRPAFHRLERSAAMMMDIGATIAMVTGAIMLFRIVPSPMKQGYMHAKLALIVLALLTTHGYLRVKVRKFREGKVVPLPGFLPPLLSLVGLALLILVIVKPF